MLNFEQFWRLIRERRRCHASQTCQKLDDFDSTSYLARRPAHVAALACSRCQTFHSVALVLPAFADHGHSCCLAHAETLRPLKLRFFLRSRRSGPHWIGATSVSAPSSQSPPTAMP